MAWYNESWTKRKKITLTGGASGATTNYQIVLTVAYDSDMQVDFDDLRFTKADGTTLVDAWLESKTDSVSAKVWVEFTTTPANTVTEDYYMYYGNSGASSNWSIANTFLFGDDFDRANSATVGNGWTEGTTFSIESNTLKISGQAADAACYKSFIPSNTVVYHAEMKQTGDSGYPQFAIPSPAGTGYCWLWALYHGTTAAIRWLDSTASWQHAATADNAYHSVEFRYNDTADTATMILDDVVKESDSGPYASNVLESLNDVVVFRNSGTSTLTYVDFVYVRKYVASPATYGFGGEESSGWSGIIMGITSPAKVMNITKSNIGKIIGI